MLYSEYRTIEMINHEHFMQGVTIQHLRFEVQPTESIVFGGQPGTALRGALYQVLSDSFCSEPNGMLTPDHVARCPVCWLLAAEDQGAARGQNIPRPLMIEPPPGQTYHRGEPLVFGLTVVGRAQDMFPYLARAVQKMGVAGLGKGRGRFRLVSIAEYHPLEGVERSILEHNFVRQPVHQVTPADISRAAAHYSSERVGLELLTPLRLTSHKELVKFPEPVAFIQRLVERCQRIAEYYAESQTPPSRSEWFTLYHELSAIAAKVCIVSNDTEWVEVYSGSRRQQRYTPISGLTGRVEWAGPLKELLPWLLWGQSLHVGKNAVKGDGWYRVSPAGV